MTELKNSPVEDFDWDAYENGESTGAKSREELRTPMRNRSTR